MEEKPKEDNQYLKIAEKPPGEDKKEEVKVEVKPEEDMVPTFVKKIDALGDQLERSCPTTAPIIYLIMFLCLFFINCVLGGHFMPDMPGVQNLFLVFFVSFHLNYLLLRLSGGLPYLENNEDNYSAKVAGFLLVAGILTLLFACNQGYSRWALFTFCSSWMISMLCENLIGDQAFFKMEILFSVLILLGAFLVQGISLSQVNFGDEKFTWSFLLALVAGLLITAFFFSFQQMSPKSSIGSIANIVHIIWLLFFPVCMPFLGKIISPSPTQWIVIIVQGCINLKAGGYLARSVQLQIHVKTRRIMIMINIIFVLFYAHEILVNGHMNAVRIIGAVVLLIGWAFLFQKIPSTVHNTKEANEASQEPPSNEKEKPILPS